MRCIAIAMLLALVSSGSMAQDCTIPPEYTNSASVVTSDNLWVGFATDKRCYDLPDTVRFYLIVKNNGTEVFSINWLMEPMNGVFVLPDGCTDLYQSGCFDNLIYRYPTSVVFYSSGVTLQPGECREWIDEQSYWDLAAGDPPAPGNYSVLGGLYEPDYDEPYYGNFRVPAGGVLLDLTIDCSIGAEPATWGSIKALFSE